MIWKRSERAAARDMKRRGFRVLARNLVIGPGEIDLLCRHRRGGPYIIVEVKARVSDGSSRRPEDQITSAKKRKLLRLARELMREDRVREAGVRIDVVAIEYDAGVRRHRALRHYEGAVPAG